MLLCLMAVTAPGKIMAAAVPWMCSEPMFTAGTTNTVYWENWDDAVSVTVYQDWDEDPWNGFRDSRAFTSTPLPQEYTFSAPENITYYYYIACKDSKGFGKESEAVSSTQDNLPPTAPVITAPDPYVSSTSFYFSWSESSDSGAGVGSYVVELWNASERIRGPESTVFSRWGISENVPGDGPYQLRVWAVDNAGNQSVTCSAFDLILENTPPTNPSNIAVEGLHAGYTNDSTPTFTWSASTDSQSGIDYYRIDLGWKGYNVSGPGPLSWTVPDDAALPDGQHIIHVSAHDKAGNSSTGIPFFFTVDTLPPTSPSSITGPSATRIKTPSFDWNECDGTGTWISGYIVEVWNGDVLVQGPYSVNDAWEVSTPLVDSNDYQLRVWSVDQAGNRSVSCAAHSFQIDTVPPEPPTDLAGPSPTIDSTPTFTWQAPADTGSPIDAFSVEVYLGTARVAGPLNIPSSSQVEWTIPDGNALSQDGRYEIRVISHDAAGNWGTADSRTEFVIDRVPPTPPLAVYVLDPWTSAPTLGWSDVRDSLSANGEVVIEVWKDRAFLSGPYRMQSPFGAGLGGQWKCPVELENGWYEFRFRAEDLAGNESGVNTCSFEIDTTPPTTPANLTGPEFVKKDLCMYTWSAPTYWMEYRLQLYRGNTLLQTVDCEGRSWTLDPATLEGIEGTYEIRVWSVDNRYDRPPAISPTYSSKTIVYDVTNPPAPGSADLGMTNSCTPTITWTPVSDAGGMAGYRIEVWRGAARVIGPTTVSQQGALCSWTVPQDQKLVIDAQYEFRIWSCDLAGNMSTQYAVQLLTLDHTPPAVLVLNPVSGSVLSINESSSLVAQVSGQTILWLKLDGSDWVDITGKAQSSGLLFYFFEVPLAPGEHTIALKAADAAGNETVRVVTFTVEAYRRGFGFGRFSFPPAP